MATASKAKKKTVRTASGLKRARQGVKENAHNSSLRSRLRTAIKAVRKAVAGGDKTVASASYQAAQKVIDSTSDKKIVHKNKAARDKSRLVVAIKAMA